MKELKEFWNTYSRYFVDVWQYLIIIVIFIIAALVILCVGDPNVYALEAEGLVCDDPRAREPHHSHHTLATRTPSR